MPGMTIRRLFAAPLMLLALVAASPRRASPPAPLPDLVRVTLTTEFGPIVLELDNKRAPVSTRNFVRYVDGRRFDGIVFYRVMRLPFGTQPSGLIQAGTRGDPKRVLPGIAHETTTQTGIKHVAGTVSMARHAPGTATGDFSILVSDVPGLDADVPGASDPAGYAAFGRVVEGMDVVRRIYDVPLSPTLGQGFLKGQMIAKPVKLLTARRSKSPTDTAPALK